MSNPPISPPPHASCSPPLTHTHLLLIEGVRKHCRKHHSVWLAELDEQVRETNQKHSAASYCSTEPGDAAVPEKRGCFSCAASQKLRKRQRVEEDASSPEADPASEPPRLIIGSTRTVASTIASKSVDFPNLSSWGSINDEFGSVGVLQPTSEESSTKPRSLLSCLDAAEQRSVPPVSQNFFSLHPNMPPPKRGMSLTSDAMLELARASEDANGSSLSLEVYFRDDPPDEGGPEDHHDSVDFLGDVFA